jgi:octopine/nopaline transport system substrate-binding protein
LRKLSLIAALAAALVAGPALAKDYKSITVATEGAYAPWNFKDAAGNLVGFELDLARDLCKRMGIECKIVEQAWDGIIPSLQAGKYDAIMAGMSITEKRKKVITFSRSYAATPARFVVLKSSGSAGFKTGLDEVNLQEVNEYEKDTIGKVVSEFKGKTIGVQTATTHENFLRAYLGKDADIRTYDTQENLDLDLQAGRVDAALASMSYWKPLLESDKGKDMTAVGPGFSGGPFGAGVGVGVRQEDQKLADMFSKVINEAIADGTVKKMAVQWFGFDASVK